MTRIDDTFRQLSQLYETNRAIQEFRKQARVREAGRERGDADGAAKAGITTPRFNEEGNAE